MATLTQPLSPISRQPFGIIGGSRLRALDSVKNHQNGYATPSLKRRFDVSELSDSENVDPRACESPAKRKRSDLNDDLLKSADASALVLNSIPSPNLVKARAETPNAKRLKIIPTPASAPLRGPAGRSPQSKPKKAFSRRSVGSYTRIDPPSFAKRHAPRAPFSIADALSGTISSYQTKQPESVLSLGDIRPKAWNFEIYADTEQEEMANLMEHSTCILDISDDEGKGSSKDYRGKENIPPQDIANLLPVSAPTQSSSSASRLLEMTDEPRSALGELDPTKFFPDGVDASSSVLVSEEAEEEPTPVDVPDCPTLPTPDGSTPTDEIGPAKPTLLTQAAITALIQSTSPAVEVQDATMPDKDAAEIEIWESGSAAEEAAAAAASTASGADTTVQIGDNLSV